MATKKKKTELPKKVGRPRVNLEFHEARELVRNEKISSVGQYHKWWLLNTPAKIPKRPDRAYKHEWISWNDFLGSNNPFPCIKRSFRPFVSARSFVHTLTLNNKSEWFEYIRTGRKPDDIPARPDLIYRNDWFTWKDFLGADKASVKRNLDAAEAIFFIVQNHGRPNNVFQMGITIEGKESILQAQQKHQFRIVGLFYCDIGFGWKSFATELGREYWDSGRNDEYTVPNINDFVFQISDFVERVR